MANTNYKSIDEYIAKQPDDMQAILERVRGAIRKAVPDANEVISYQIPAYRLPAGVVIYFAGWKEHYSIYPATPRVVSTFKAELEPYELSKGTVRFPRSKAVPVRLIARIAKLRAEETLERAISKRKAAPQKKAKPKTKPKAEPKTKPRKKK